MREVSIWEKYRANPSVAWAILSIAVVATVYLWRYSIGASPKLVHYFGVGSIGLILWLCGASWFIRVATDRFEEFKKEIRNVPSILPASSYSQLDAFVISPTSARWYSIIFGLIGMAATGFPVVVLVTAVLPPSIDVWALGCLFGLVLLVCWFAGQGFQGAMATYKVVKVVARESRDGLFLFHVDHQAGLGLARRLADTASLFILTGACALPTGFIAATRGYEWAADRTNPEWLQIYGSSMALFSLMSIAIGLIFVFVPGAGARVVISQSLHRFKDKQAREVAAARAEMAKGVTWSSGRDVIDQKEKAIRRLEIGVLASGGWMSTFRSIILAGVGLVTAATATDSSLREFLGRMFPKAALVSEPLVPMPSGVPPPASDEAPK